MNPGPETPLAATVAQYLGPAPLVAAGAWAVMETAAVGKWLLTRTRLVISLAWRQPPCCFPKALPRHRSPSGFSTPPR